MHVAHGFGVGFWRGQVLDARPQAALDVVLQTRPGMVSGEVDLTGWDEKMTMDEIHNPVGKVSGEIRPEIDAAVFAQAARAVNPGKAFPQRELNVRKRLAVAKQDVEAPLLLLGQVVLH